MNNSQYMDLNLMAQRLNFRGGKAQQKRMIRDKR
jgi:hypothetical protein